MTTTETTVEMVDAEVLADRVLARLNAEDAVVDEEHAEILALLRELVSSAGRVLGLLRVEVTR